MGETPMLRKKTGVLAGGRDMLPRFFCPDFDEARAALEGDELHHLRAVRRLGPGDAVELFDGRGRLAECAISRLDKRRAELQVRRLTRSAEPRLRLTVATAIPKGERMDWLVEKTTELGVWAIWPLVAERSTVAACGQEKQRRWQRRAVEAAKQCGRLWLPEISPPRSLDEAVAEIAAQAAASGPGASQQGAMLSLAKACPGASSALLILLADASPEAPPILDVLSAARASTVVGFVGPEGGFTESEQAALRAAGARPARLAAHTLRIETAALALAAAVAALP